MDLAPFVIYPALNTASFTKDPPFCRLGCFVRWKTPKRLKSLLRSFRIGFETRALSPQCLFDLVLLTEYVA